MEANVNSISTLEGLLHHGMGHFYSVQQETAERLATAKHRSCQLPGLLRVPEPASVSRLSISEGGGEGPRAGSGWGGNSRQTGRWAYGHLRCPQGEWRWNDGVGHRMLWAMAAMREPRGPREFRQEKVATEALQGDGPGQDSGR